MTAYLPPYFQLQFFDTNGVPLAGGKLYTYSAGTTTPLATYTDSTGGTPNTNPVILDSAGRADVWLGSSSYKFVLTDAADVTVKTIDNIQDSFAYTDALQTALASTSDVTKGDAYIGVKRTATGAAATTLHSYIEGQTFNAKTDFGAKGDGSTDDTTVLQTAIDTICNAGGGTLYFPPGTYKVLDKTLVIWGRNVVIRGAGQGATIIRKYGLAGQFGDCFDIYGKLNGAKYWGMSSATTFGGGDYGTKTIYTGSTVQSSNVAVMDITFDTDSGVTDNLANTVGVVNSTNIVFQRCTFSNAPQTNAACVNDTNSAACGRITFEDCTFTGAKQHQVRVQSYNSGASVGISAAFERCRFLSVAGAEINDSSIVGRYVHLFYRAGVASDAVNCSVRSCYFDSTGSICATNSAKNLELRGNFIECGMYLVHSASITPGNIAITDNTFTCAAAKTAFTSEFYFYIANPESMIFSRNRFNTTVVTGNTLSQLCGFYSPVGCEMTDNVNFSMGVSVNVATPSDLLIARNRFAKNSVSTTERGLSLTGNNILVTDNVMANTMVYVAGNTTNLQVINNKFALTTNEGYDVVGGPGTQTNTTVLGNTVVETGSYPTSNRAMLSAYVGHIVDNNRLIDPSGNVVGQGLRLAAAPSAGYSRVGDRHWNSAPALNNVMFVCTVSGTPGTWVTQ